MTPLVPDAAPLRVRSEDERGGTPSLAAGFLAALPLFAAYEIGLATLPHAERASAERVLGRILFMFGEHASAARIAVVLVSAALAWSYLRRREAVDGRALARSVLEGVLAGLLLGPLLVALQAWLGAGPLQAPDAPTRTLAGALRLVGTAPWEELLFRAGLFGGIFLLVRRGADFLGLHGAPARLAAELAALLGSALLFAAFHLETVQQVLGSSGESFHRGAFFWRLSAGLLLGGLFRLRGFGVAAWAHAVFNVGMALGLAT